MLPALLEADLPAFGEALYEFNRRVGEMFRPIQGGIYAHPRSAAIVEFVRKQSIAGVGQSSWGPALFAIAERDRADWLAICLREQFGFSTEEVLVTGASCKGAEAAR
jgi:predicted sugar kinase